MSGEKKRDLERLELLQAAIDAAGVLGRAYRSGTADDRQLDLLAGEVIQRLTAFRASIHRQLVHRRSVLPEMGYDGSACLDVGGETTEDPSLVTCPRCKPSNHGKSGISP